MKRWKSIFQEEKFKEGTWVFKKELADQAIEKIRNLKFELYGTIGDDIVFDGLDQAIARINDMKKMEWD